MLTRIFSRAMKNRADPASFDIIRGSWASVLDPLLTPEQKQTGNLAISTAIILACKPFHWKNEFPIPMALSRELKEQVMQKWGDFIIEQ